jgi:DMSO/TMAO reductase YedYZ molybdopterin-dependent catalytic subunit
MDVYRFSTRVGFLRCYFLPSHFVIGGMHESSISRSQHLLLQTLCRVQEVGVISLVSLSSNSIDAISQLSSQIMPDLGFDPLNREPPATELVSSFLTTKDAYDRNHGGIPEIDASKHHVRVDGAVKDILDLSMSDLEALPQHTVVSALQCAGIRRHTMRTAIKEVQGIDWFDGAVMNCKWRGPRLKDILEKAQVTLAKEEKGHVAFASHVQPCQEDEWYGASIDLGRALEEDKDVILALEVSIP